jgi:hypothetical protein
MLVLWVCELLVGMMLGQRFTVRAMAPAILLSVVLSVGVAIAGDDTLWGGTADAMIAIACLQVGYFAGVCIRHLLVPVRAGRLGGATLEVS